MKPPLSRIAPLLALCGVLAACAAAGAPNPKDPVATACAEVDAVRASPDGATLDKLDPHSSAGVLWADAKAACAAGVAKPGINQAWLLGVLSFLAKAAPIVAPVILGAI
jgi:hypothetical protein